jgi:MFS family permease
MKLPGSLQPLRHSDFRRYWIGQAVSLVGTWMQVMALGWVVTGLSSDALVLGLLNASSALPILLLSLKGGEIADRVEKRRILIVTQLALMALAFVTAALVSSGRIQLWHVFALSVVQGVATAFDLPAAQSMPPELVEPKEIPNAVGLMQSIFHGARLVGPAVAGILIARLGNASAFVANGASFVAVIGTLLAITPRPPKPRAAGQRGGGRARIAEGFAYVRKDRATSALITLLTLVTTFVFPFLVVLMVYYVRYTLGVDDASDLGTLMSTSGLGSLTGSIALLSGSARTRRAWLVGAVVGVALGMLGLSLAHDLAHAVPCSFVLSFSVSSLMGRVSQMIQERVPGELRGRVVSITSLAFTGVMPFAGMAWSFLVDRLGHGPGYARVMQISAGAFAVLALLVVLRAWSTLVPVDAAPASASGGPT